MTLLERLATAGASFLVIALMSNANPTTTWPGEGIYRCDGSGVCLQIESYTQPAGSSSTRALTAGEGFEILSSTTGMEPSTEASRIKEMDFVQAAAWIRWKAPSDKVGMAMKVGARLLETCAV